MDDTHAAGYAMHSDTVHTAHSPALVAGPLNGDWAGGPLQPTGDCTCRDVHGNNDHACTNTRWCHHPPFTPSSRLHPHSLANTQHVEQKQDGL
jgi:hypothetical protein